MASIIMNEPERIGDLRVSDARNLNYLFAYQVLPEYIFNSDWTRLIVTMYPEMPYYQGKWQHLFRIFPAEQKYGTDVLSHSAYKIAEQAYCIVIDMPEAERSVEPRYIALTFVDGRIHYFVAGIPPLRRESELTLRKVTFADSPNASPPIIGTVIGNRTNENCGPIFNDDIHSLLTRICMELNLDADIHSADSNELNKFGETVEQFASKRPVEFENIAHLGAIYRIVSASGGDTTGVPPMVMQGFYEKDPKSMAPLIRTILEKSGPMMAELESRYAQPTVNKKRQEATNQSNTGLLNDLFVMRIPIVLLSLFAIVVGGIWISPFFSEDDVVKGSGFIFFAIVLLLGLIIVGMRITRNQSADESEQLLDESEKRGTYGNLAQKIRGGKSANSRLRETEDATVTIVRRRNDPRGRKHLLEVALESLDVIQDDLNAPLSIFIDDKRVGSLLENESSTFNVPAGRHKIHASLPKIQSNTISFDTINSGSYHFWCQTLGNQIALQITR